MMISAISLYGLSNQNINQQDKNSSTSSFSESVTKLNQEIRLEYIKIAEQTLKQQHPPVHKVAHTKKQSIKPTTTKK